VTDSYLDRLAARSAAVGTVLCVGLDPDVTALPASFSRDLAGLERYTTVLIEATAPYAAAYKANLAFYESHGVAGSAVLERIRARIPAGVPFIADAKRGDIGSTTAHHAVALFDRLGADAVTVHPYTGSEGLAPLLEREDRFAYILCRTSNPGAAELQNLTVEADPASDAPAEPFHVRVARHVAGWGPGRTVGLVVGATAPAELEAIRAVAQGLPVLVPGIGAQGGEIEPVLLHGPATAAPAGDRPGRGLLVNVSRGISGRATAASGPGSAAAPDPASTDVARILAEAAREWASRLPVLR
jgi:orotidine-5'-phosphate decarboxylase